MALFSNWMNNDPMMDLKEFHVIGMINMKYYSEPDQDLYLAPSSSSRYPHQVFSCDYNQTLIDFTYWVGSKLTPHANSTTAYIGKMNKFVYSKSNEPLCSFGFYFRDCDTLFLLKKIYGTGEVGIKGIFSSYVGSLGLFNTTKDYLVPCL